MPDSNNMGNLKQLLIEVRSLLTTEVSYACRKYNHGAPPEEIEEFSEQITLLLLEDDCRRLQTYDPQKAKLKTWLRHVVRHHVSHYFQKLPASEPLEELAEAQVSAAASQEKELLAKEERALLHEAIKQLTPHDQRLVHLKLNGASDEEIAEAMNIKLRSVQQEWSKIGRKLKAIFEKNGGGKTYATLTR